MKNEMPRLFQQAIGTELTQIVEGSLHREPSWQQRSCDENEPDEMGLAAATERLLGVGASTLGRERFGDGSQRASSARLNA